MSEPEVHRSAPKGTTLERDKNDVLGAARPLPPMPTSLSMTSPRMRIVSFLLPSSKHEPRLPGPGRDRHRGLRPRHPAGTARNAAGATAGPGPDPPPRGT